MSAPHTVVSTAANSDALTHFAVQGGSPLSPCDQTTKAVLEYFEATSNPARDDAFEHLMAILFKATRTLFLVEEGLSSYEATHRFLEEWLVEKLFQYEGTSMDDIRDAARKDAFRYFGRQCKFALVDEMRRRDRSEDALDQHSTFEEKQLGRGAKVVHIDASLSDDDDGDTLTLGDFLALDTDHGLGSPIGQKPRVEASGLLEKLRQMPEEVRKLLGERSVDALSAICELFPDKLARKGDVSAAIAASNGITPQSARRLHRDLVNKLQAGRGNSAIQDLFRFIRKAGGPTVLSFCSWTPKTQTE
jgi:hypothetical protein